ncbi:MAG: flagellar motor switch protein FliN [Dethiosulfovibrio peptidovorans]|nr:MAG: flagellar motor switch protein FliN [Dethiosulfovibrio peptidovorans]
MIDDLLSQDEINALLDGPAEDNAVVPLTQPQLRALETLSEIFVGAMSSVVGMLAGREVLVSVDEIGEKPQSQIPESTEGDRQLVFTVYCDGFDDAPVVMVMSEVGVLMLADLMMGGEGKELPDEANELFVNAAQEGLSQVVGAAMTALSGTLKGRRVMPTDPGAEIVGESEWFPLFSLPTEEMVWTARMAVTIEALEPFPCVLVMPSSAAVAFADALLDVEVPQDQESPVPDAPAAARAEIPQQQVQTQPQFQSQAQPLSQVDVRPAQFSPLLAPQVGEQLPSNIGLIVDIPVRITVELGRTRKSVGEILSFAPGSVIELEKMAGEPVDVLVNGKPIAKGEVVVIDENFGVRVTEILNMGGKIQTISS